MNACPSSRCVYSHHIRVSLGGRCLAYLPPTDWLTDYMTAFVTTVLITSVLITAVLITTVFITADFPTPLKREKGKKKWNVTKRMTREKYILSKFEIIIKKWMYDESSFHYDGCCSAALFLKWMCSLRFLLTAPLPPPPPTLTLHLLHPDDPLCHPPFILFLTDCPPFAHPTQDCAVFFN